LSHYIDAEETGPRETKDLYLDTVINWKEIVDIYYQTTGKRNPLVGLDGEGEDVLLLGENNTAVSGTTAGENTAVTSFQRFDEQRLDTSAGFRGNLLMSSSAAATGVTTGKESAASAASKLW
jgi:hypothetical protein